MADCIPLNTTLNKENTYKKTAEHNILTYKEKKAW